MDWSARKCCIDGSWAQGWVPHGNSLATQIRRQQGEDGLMFGTSIVVSKIIGS